MLILLDLILLTVLGFVILENQHAFNLDWNLGRVERISWMKEVLPPYLFLAASLFIIMGFLGVVVILAFPKQYFSISLNEGTKGKLTVSPSAIEGYVREVLTKNELMKNSKIQVKIYKRQLRINVKGEIVPQTQVIDKTQGFKNEITTGLNTYFGITHHILLKVSVKANHLKEKPSNPRVI